MRNSDYFKGKKVTIVGFARSGLTCANLLNTLGAQVSITDIQDNPLTRSALLKLNSQAIKTELGKHSREFITGRDLVVTSPGVADSSLALKWAEELGVPVISEIEVGSILCPARIIAVTGSNGKTTVTTLIGKILEAGGKNVFVCGNIGRPFTGEVQKMQRGDFVSLEVSSFQLEKIKDFKPEISLILNFTPNHLDRYKDMQEYLQAKKRIFTNQDENDFLLLNADDPALGALAREAGARVVYFSKTEGFNPNQAAVAAVGKILGIEKEVCLEVFRKFSGVEHRLEYVTEINRVKFINDSKATTVNSALWALENITVPVVLIAGGRDKGLDYSAILPAARRIRAVVLIGEAREKIKAALAGGVPVNESASLEEAVSVAFKQARPGDAVLLSPMCSSFDMFSDYEERGRMFKKAVLNLARGK